MPAKLTQGPRVGQDLSRTSAGLMRGPNRKKTLTPAPWSGTWPAPGATLDLDFANNRGFVRGVGQGGAMDAVTFTRASRATYVDQNGILQTTSAPNLLSFTQEFDNAYWSKFNVSISANQEVAPDGTLTADKLIQNTNSSDHNTFLQFNQTGALTVSCYMKAAELSWGILRLDSATVASYCFFDLTNGTVGNLPAGVTGSISSAGNGWYRCAASRNVIAGSNYIGQGLTTTNGVNSYAGANNTSGIYIWGAQLETGPTVTEYFPTNINQPRFDWASTAVVQGNIVTNSDYPASWGSSNVAVTLNATTDPEGGNTGVLLTENASGSHRASFNVQLVAGTTYTFSAHFKDNDRQFAAIVSVNFNNFASNFDLVNEIAVAGNNSPIVSITNIGSGWFRCSMTFTANTTTTSLILVGLNNSASGAGAADYASEGKSLYVWGPQVQTGSNATTYLKTGATLPSRITLAANPTSNGLLIEESRTNRILWNRDATQANWVSTNITAAKDQTGIDGVANAASSLTATSADGTCIQTITLASGSRTGSVYLKRLTGTGTVQVSLDGSTWSTVDLSDTEWRRIVLSGTVTNPTVGIKIATSGDAVAMDYAQVEDGAFATTPILTTTATVTRSGDTATMSGQNFLSWFKQGDGTIFSQNTPLFLSTSFLTWRTNDVTNQTLELDNRSIENYKLNYQSGLFLRINIPPTVNVKNKYAVTFGRVFSIARNGDTVITSSYAGGLPTLFTTLAIGSAGNGTSFGNTSISRITYYPVSSTNNALLEMTKP